MKHMRTKNQLTTEDLKEQLLAKQLRRPDGEEGIRLGQIMNIANKALYQQTLDLLRINDNDRVLEIGFGNGRLFDDLYVRASGLKVEGIEFSKTMLMEAIEQNIRHIRNGCLSLYYG